MLLIHPPFMLKLHGERRQIGEVVLLLAAGTILAAGLAAGVAAATRLVAPLAGLAAPAVLALSAPGEALAATERDGQVRLLVIAGNGELGTSAGLLLFDRADEIGGAAD